MITERIGYVGKKWGWKHVTGQLAKRAEISIKRRRGE